MKITATDSIPKKQLDLSRQAKAKTTKFMRDLFNSGIKDAFIRFSKENYKLDKDDDPDMTLEKFISMLGKSRTVTLQVRIHEPENQIRFCAIIESYGFNSDSRLVWFLCELNEENYKIVNQLFKEAYGKSIEEF